MAGSIFLPVTPWIIDVSQRRDSRSVMECCSLKSGTQQGSLLLPQAAHAGKEKGRVSLFTDGVMLHTASLVSQLAKNPPALLETWVHSLGWEDPLEKGMATHASILACNSLYSASGCKELVTTEQWLILGIQLHTHIWD